MSEQNIEQRIARLTQEIIRHNELYYRRAEPEISDLEYDRLKEDLASLESSHPNLIRPDSPTRKVGDDRLAGFSVAGLWAANAFGPLGTVPSFEEPAMRSMSSQCCSMRSVRAR